ncbi:MAG: AraC family transcriptional regulator [Bacteroidetes bacterium]|nr:AraC family transcriptional regulator [Bacteroidota bacterium]
MIVNLPEDINSSNIHNSLVYKIDDSSVVYVNRLPVTKKAKINLTQHLIVFGVNGQKKFMAPELALTLEENEAVFLKKGLFVSTEKVAQNYQYESVLFFLGDQFLANFHQKNEQHLKTLGQPEGKGSNGHYKFDATPSLIGYINSLLPYFKGKSPLNDALLRLKIEELLLGFLMNDQQEQFKDFLVQLNKKSKLNIEALMLKNVNSNLSVEELAFLSGMSVSSFKRYFQKHFEKSPAKWISEKRLEWASNLLNNTEKNINEIAFELGYENTSHFIQKFQSNFGATPKKYRERLVKQ